MAKVPFRVFDGALRAALVTMVALAAAPAAALDVGAPAPVIKAASLRGKETMVPRLKGRVTLVDFWASWCAPCLVSLPEMEQLRRELHAAGYKDRFEIVAINVDTDDGAALKFLQEKPVSYPVLADPEGKWPEAFGLPGMPTSYLVDAAGNVAYVHEGYRPGDAAALRAKILALLGKPR